MPSGARKRKAAAKKKVKNGEAHNNSSRNSSSSNSSSIHSHGSEDPRSLDDRQSDSGEIEREEEEGRREVEADDYEKGDGTNGKGLQEEIADENESVGVDFSDVDVATEAPIGVVTSEDKEIAVEEEKSMVDVNSVLDPKLGDGIPKQDAIAMEGASVELVKDVVSLAQEINVGFGSSVASELVESGLMKNADLAFQISDEKEKFSSISEDLQSEKVESKIVSMVEDNSSVTLPVDPSSGVDAVKTVETSNASTVTATQVVEDVKNKETVQQSDNQAGFTVVSTTSEVDNVKEMETQKRSMDQPLIDSNPLPVQRTSLLGCCGLFELFSGANR